MRKNNKDYKPKPEYIADQRKKRAIAENLAAQVHALTAYQHVDIRMLIGALQGGLLSTSRAAKELGLSSRAFLRLRRKYGLEPVHKERLCGEPHKVLYLYAPAQLTAIPPVEIERSKRRSALAMGRQAKKSAIDVGIGWANVLRRSRGPEEPRAFHEAGGHKTKRPVDVYL